MSNVPDSTPTPAPPKGELPANLARELAAALAKAGAVDSDFYNEKDAPEPLRHVIEILSPVLHASLKAAESELTRSRAALLEMEAKAIGAMVQLAAERARRDKPASTAPLSEMEKALREAKRLELAAHRDYTQPVHELAGFPLPESEVQEICAHAFPFLSPEKVENYEGCREEPHTGHMDLILRCECGARFEGRLAQK